MKKPTKITASELILTAIFYLQQKNGVSTKEITKYICGKRGYKQNQVKDLVKKTLDRATKSGIFSKKKGLYRIESRFGWQSKSYKGSKKYNKKSKNRIMDNSYKKMKKAKNSNFKESCHSIKIISETMKTSDVAHVNSHKSPSLELSQAESLGMRESSKLFGAAELFLKRSHEGNDLHNHKSEIEYFEPAMLKGTDNDDDDDDDFLNEDDDDDDDDDFFEENKVPEIIERQKKLSPKLKKEVPKKKVSNKKKNNNKNKCKKRKVRKTKAKAKYSKNHGRKGNDCWGRLESFDAEGKACDENINQEDKANDLDCCVENGNGDDNCENGDNEENAGEGDENKDNACEGENEENAEGNEDCEEEDCCGGHEEDDDDEDENECCQNHEDDDDNDDDECDDNGDDCDEENPDDDCCIDQDSGPECCEENNDNQDEPPSKECQMKECEKSCKKDCKAECEAKCKEECQKKIEGEQNGDGGASPNESAGCPPGTAHANPAAEPPTQMQDPKESTFMSEFWHQKSHCGSSGHKRSHSSDISSFDGAKIRCKRKTSKSRKFNPQ